MWALLLVSLTCIAADNLNLNTEIMIDGIVVSIGQHLKDARICLTSREIYRKSLRLYEFDMSDYILFHHGYRYGSSNHPVCWKESTKYDLSSESALALENNEGFVFKTEDLLKVPPVICVVFGIMEYKHNTYLTKGAQSLIKYSVNKQLFCELLKPCIFPSK